MTPLSTIRPVTVCPDCSHPGPHQTLDHGWVECGNRHTGRLTTGQWTVCGATWSTPTDPPNRDPVTDRLIRLLGDSADVDLTEHDLLGSVLHEDTVVALAETVAGDRELRARIVGTYDLYGRSTPGGAA